MKKNDFASLLSSIKQAGKIRKGKKKSSRTFRYSKTDVKAIRQSIHGVKGGVEFGEDSGVWKIVSVCAINLHE